MESSCSGDGETRIRLYIKISTTIVSMLLGGCNTMRNLENATPGVTDIQPVNLVAAPFGPPFTFH